MNIFKFKWAKVGKHECIWISEIKYENKIIPFKNNKK